MKFFSSKKPEQSSTSYTLLFAIPEEGEGLERERTVPHSVGEVLVQKDEDGAGSYERFREARGHLKLAYAYLEFGMLKEAILSAMKAMGHPEVRPLAREVIASCLMVMRRKGTAITR
jgi:hypothetical protein